MKKVSLVSALLLVACIPNGVISSFEECAQAGNAVMESYPRQCRTDDGTLFVEDIGNAIEKAGLIVVDMPRPNEEVAFPLEISGRARGTWFFEASFPVDVKNDAEEVLTTVIATAQDDWMTEDFVPFLATVESGPTEGRGMLVLRKDNPSGLPEYEDQLRIPVIFGGGD